MFYDHEVTDVSDAVDVQAFTAERVRAITELSLRQLQYWDERGFLKPSLTARQGRGRRRLYSFGDLVSLKVAGKLRKLGISLQQIRKVDAHLREFDYRNPLAELRFFVSGSVLYFEESGTVRTGRELEQVLASYMVPVGEIAHSLAGQIAQLHERRPGEIERRRGTLGAQPLIKGTRIAVASIKRLAADGAGQTEILEMYPDLTPADVRAALATETPPRRRRRAG
jgi:DNA-binding transcriptional MerR regulator